MGVVSAWIKVLSGLFVIGGSYIFAQPIFDFLFAFGIAMGGNAAKTASFLDSALTYIPVAISLSLILWGFIAATTTENSSGYR